MAITLEALRDEYQNLYDTLGITQERLATIDRIIDTILRKQSVYEAISQDTGVPWAVVAVIHNLEGSLNFNTHLHNGDPLTARTVHVPRGRPRTGTPPFTFQESAADALEHDGLADLSDWTLPAALFRLEKFNGFGYRRRRRPINTPYLWSFCNHYTKGKFTADGTFDAEAVSEQCGAAVLLRRMEERGIFSFTVQRKTIAVSLNNTSIEVPAFVEAGNTWIAPRPLSPFLSGFSVLAVRSEPAFAITVGYRRRDVESTEPDTLESREFPGRLIRGTGYLDASDLVRDFIRLGLDFDATVTPPCLLITAPDDVLTPEARDSGAAPVVPTGTPTPLSETPLPLQMPFAQKLVQVATEEFTFFDEHDLTECGNAMGSQRVASYWRDGLNISNRTGCNNIAWSAAFICFCLRKAGMPSVEFPFDEGHHTYIRWAVRNTKRNLPEKTYYGRRLEEYQAKPGDLIAQWRKLRPSDPDPNITFDNIPDGFFPSHCDIVVEVTPTRVITIGGNVSNRVKKTEFAAHNGILTPTRQLICVLECRKS